jgi:hypothetical protein
MNAILLLKLSDTHIDMCFHRIKMVMQGDDISKAVKMDFRIERAGTGMRNYGGKGNVERYWFDGGRRYEKILRETGYF